MVPSYDHKIGEVLKEFGFTSGKSYDVMVKTLAIPVEKAVPGMAYVER